MKILIVNPIIYTSETRDIKKVNTIKDTMIYDLSLGFMQKGIDVTLIACSDYKPLQKESYPFNVVWLDAKIKKLFPSNTIPYCPDIKRYIKNNKFDLIITSEIFSLNSLMLSVRSKKNLIVWHELGKHNKLMHQLPSKIWYNIIARLFFRNTKIVARSVQARAFISQFCNNVSDTVIDHGVNLEKFKYETEKENYFAVSSQLIKRKRIDKIIKVFSEYVKEEDSTCKLYIMGEGEERENLEALAEELKISNNVIFTGKLPHSELVGILSKAKAMLVYTESDLNMVSIVESLAMATPVVTTCVPYSCHYIKKYKLGIADDDWNARSLVKICNDNSYIQNCLSYRPTLNTEYKVEQFLNVYKQV